MPTLRSHLYWNDATHSRRVQTVTTFAQCVADGILQFHNQGLGAANRELLSTSTRMLIMCLDITLHQHYSKDYIPSVSLTNAELMNQRTLRENQWVENALAAQKQSHNRNNKPTRRGVSLPNAEDLREQLLSQQMADFQALNTALNITLNDQGEVIKGTKTKNTITPDQNDFVHFLCADVLSLQQQQRDPDEKMPFAKLYWAPPKFPSVDLIAAVIGLQQGKNRISKIFWINVKTGANAATTIKYDTTIASLLHKHYFSKTGVQDGGYQVYASSNMTAVDSSVVSNQIVSYTEFGVISG